MQPPHPEGRPEDDAVLWRAFARATPDVVLVVDPEGTIQFVNRVVPAWMGRPILGTKVWEFAGEGARDRIMARLREVVASGKATHYESAGLRGDGSPGWYEVSIIPVLEPGRDVRLLWRSTDVTERRALEEQLRQSQKMEAIGVLAGGVAHDFNNLLAVILGFSELASRKLPPGHPVASQLAEVFDAARRGGELTRKLLAFSRKQILESRPVELRAAVTDFTRLLSRILGEDVELTVVASPDPLVVEADTVQLEQVLLNLCTNARQAMPQGGTLRLSTRAVTFDEPTLKREPWGRPGQYAEIAVTDTGIGMDEATRQRVFEPFFTTKTTGTGLGLATVYGIVQQHGGFIHVESARGKGTTFRVLLPRRDGPPGEPPEAEVSSRPDELVGSETILVAEDEPSLRSLVTMSLSELGYTVIPTPDGEAAVRTFEARRREISLVLLDVVMPRLDAREAYERLRALDPGVRVLFMTGYAPESTRMAALLESGKVPVLEKPFTPQALAAKIRSVLDGTELRSGRTGRA